jgi:hypothetical protein
MARIVSQLNGEMLMAQYRKATKAKNGVILFDDSFTVKGCISELRLNENLRCQQFAPGSSWHSTS